MSKSPRRALIALSLAVSSLAAPGAQAVQPNVLFILIDDLGARDLSCYGSSFYETPRIDQLAGEGARFTDASVAHPRCVPSRVSLMLGRVPAGVGCPGGSAWKGHLPAESRTIGHAMQDAGYETGYIGKWHLGGEGALPSDLGFDISIAAGAAGSPRAFFAPYDGPFPPSEAWRARNPDKAPIGLDDAPDGEYLTDRLTDEAIDFIATHHATHPDSPFFLILSHYAVHQPIDAKDEPVRHYRRKLQAMPEDDAPEFLPRDGVTKARQDDAPYAAMIESVDESVGRLMNTLDRLDLDDDTIVFFTSDHGGLSNRGADHRRSVETSNLPLRAGKGHLYEGGLRVPLIVRWPGVVEPGTESSFVTVNTDFFPTLLDIAGGEPTAEPHLDGTSIEPALRGESNVSRPPIFWHSPRARPGPTGDHNSSAVRIGDWKLLHFHDDDRVELYHLGVDPSETTNLAGAEPEKTDELRARLDDWRESINAPASRPNN
ncbi:MAG: sulfatase [Planctomycetota bacterium]